MVFTVTPFRSPIKENITIYVIKTFYFHFSED